MHRSGGGVCTGQVVGYPEVRCLDRDLKVENVRKLQEHFRPSSVKALRQEVSGLCADTVREVETVEVTL